MSYFFSLSWIWLIFGYLFLISIAFGISNGIPALLRYVIFKFYGINWFICVVHSLAGLLGVIVLFLYLSSTPPVIVIGEDRIFFISGMWMLAPFKTVILALPFLGIFISIIWANTAAPIYIKLPGLDPSKEGH